MARFVRRVPGLDHEEVEGQEGQIDWEDPKRVPPVQIDFASEQIPEDGTSCAGFPRVRACLRSSRLGREWRYRGSNVERELSERRESFDLERRCKPLKAESQERHQPENGWRVVSATNRGEVGKTCARCRSRWDGNHRQNLAVKSRGAPDVKRRPCSSRAAPSREGRERLLPRTL